MTGTEGDDVIVGAGGSDQINGLGGDDVICGGDDDDEIDGGPGSDIVAGGGGDDNIVGGDDDDELVGNDGADVVNGGTGTDRCEAETISDCETEFDELTDPTPGLPQSENLPSPPAPQPGLVTATGLNGVSVTLESETGIHPWDISFGLDIVATRRVRDVLASPVYAVDVRPGRGTFSRGLLTLPYNEEALQGFSEQNLRILTFDEQLHLWVSPVGTQSVDVAANTVTVEIDHLSSWAVFKDSGNDTFRPYWAENEVFCIQDDGGTAGVDVAFLMDVSGSMIISDPDDLRVDAAQAFLSAMRSGDRAGVAGWDSLAVTEIGLTSLGSAANVEAVNQALERTGRDVGGTNISSAVQTANALLEDSPTGRPRIALLLTDGQGTYDSDLTVDARIRNIRIYTVGLGEGVDAALLQSIADGTNASFSQLQSADQLVPLYEQISGSIFDDGTDTDGDGLTDCEETNGMVATWGLFDTDIENSDNEPFLGDHRVVTEPNDSDTDDDGRPDGLEMGIALDLGDSPLTREHYGFLIDLGVFKYFAMVSDPNSVDGDGDGVSDFDEVNGRLAGEWRGIRLTGGQIR